MSQRSGERLVIQNKVQRVVFFIPSIVRQGLGDCREPAFLLLCAWCTKALDTGVQTATTLSSCPEHWSAQGVLCRYFSMTK
eukprot:5735319-Amphidinium_carterae.1